MTIILQHEIETTPGSVVDWLRAHQMPFKICRIYENDPFPSLNEFSNLIICGGSMNVDQETQFSWLSEEKALIEQAIEAKKKVVGLCLGSQLIAEVLGAKVGRMKYSEAGWQPMSILANEVAGTKTEKLAVFQWHSYCFENVPDAKEFAGNDAWRHQAYTYQQHVMAFQFHPETTAAWAIECAEDKVLPKGEFCQTPEQIKSQLHLQKPLQVWFFNCLSHFLV